MNARAISRLHDARQACQLIQEFTQGQDFAEYERNLLLRSAVERQFEILGEALRQAEVADATVAQAIPDLRRIVGLRNRLIHGYDAVDNQLVWDVVQTEISPLLEQIVPLLEG